MGASESTFVGGSLLAVCLLVSGAAHAMEPAQSRASTSSLPALSLPAFLDGNRVPDMQEAWQAHVRTPQEEPQVEDGNVAVAPATKDAAMSAARAAMERAGQESSEAADVRQRAEELSRRFGAGGVASEPVGSIERPSAVATPAAIAATPPPPQVKQVVVAPLDTGADTGAGVGTVNAKTAATGTSAPARTPDIDIGQKLRLAAPLPPRDIPPTPVRAPRDTASITEPPNKVGGPPVARSVPARKSSRKVDVTGDVLPTELRAFGWNAQPE
jgi:hypothetical protein